MAKAEQIIEALGLQPHPMEGGWFRETYRSSASVAAPGGDRSLGTAIYYLLTPTTVSAMHRLPGDEIFHFYAGDPVRMIQLLPDGTGKEIVLGSNVLQDHLPQVVVPGGVWQGSYLIDGGCFALLGATMAPGFDYADYVAGLRAPLSRRYADFADSIARLTPGG